MSRRRQPAAACDEDRELSTSEGSPAGASTSSSSRACSRSPLSGLAAYDLDFSALGCGGSATVRIARPRAGGPRCAVKTLRKEDSAAQRLAQNEASALESLSHPGICKLVDTFEDEDSFHLVLEYIEGHELFEEIAAQSPMGERRAAEVTRQLLAALRHCHERGVVHRDVKPENIMVASGAAGPQVKLIDFGLAVGRGQQCTGVAGTQPYLAPETFSGACSPALDMWSAGVVLYACLLGELPPPAVRSGAVPVLQAEAWSRARVSTAARDLVARLMRSDPAERLTAAEAAQHQWLQGDFAPQQPLRKAAEEAARSWQRSCAKVMHARRVVQTLRECVAEASAAPKEQTTPVLEGAPKEHLGRATVVVEAALDVLDAVVPKEVAGELVALIDAATAAAREPRHAAPSLGSSLFGGCCVAEVDEYTEVVPMSGRLSEAAGELTLGSVGDLGI